MSDLKRLKHKLQAIRIIQFQSLVSEVLILGECFNDYFDKRLTIRTNTLSMRQVLSCHVVTNVKLTHPKEPSRCNALCYEVISEFVPISNLLVMIRLFRLLASY